MKLLLTSFGLSHLNNKGDDNINMFYRMPPVAMSSVGQQFLPDYVTLLLANKVIIDCQTYDRLISNSSHSSYKSVAIMIKRLYEEGFVQIEDFDEVIKQNESLLEKMLEQDLKSLDLWIKPLKESVSYWENFVSKFDGELRDEYLDYHQLSPTPHYHHRETVLDQFLHQAHFGDMVLNPDQAHMVLNLDQAFYQAHWIGHRGSSTIGIKRILNSPSAKRRTSAYRQVLKKYLIGHLSYVNANILLSQTFNTGFHDWYDFKPFYQEKFLRVAKESSPGEKEIENIKKLFEISFPEFSFWQPDNVLKALKDKRIQELRQLIDSACKGEVEFDREFANRILREVLKVETDMKKYRNIVSYITMPLGFIPTIGTPIQKAAEELITKRKELKKTKEFRWFYMISELAHKPVSK